jgi:hypothetical protein
MAMKEVIQLVGRDKGKRVMMPYAVATACVSAGTAIWPDDVAKVRVRGLKIEESKSDAPRDQAKEPAAVPESDAVVDDQSTPVSDGEDEEAGPVSTDVREGVPGWIPEGTVEVNGTVIPADWRALQWKQRVALAVRISGKPVEGVSEANAIIEEAVASIQN